MTLRITAKQGFFFFQVVNVRDGEWVRGPSSHLVDLILFFFLRRCCNEASPEVDIDVVEADVGDIDTPESIDIRRNESLRFPSKSSKRSIGSLFWFMFIVSMATDILFDC